MTSYSQYPTTQINFNKGAAFGEVVIMISAQEYINILDYNTTKLAHKQIKLTSHPDPVTKGMLHFVVVRFSLNMKYAEPIFLDALKAADMAFGTKELKEARQFKK